MGSFWCHCGVTLHTLDSFWDHFRHMRVTLESLWSVFKKHSFPQSILMILCNSGVNLEPWGSFWRYLGYMSVTLDHLGQLWGRLSPCVRPKGGHKQEIHIFVGDFAYQRSHEDAKESLRLSGPDRLGGGRGRVPPPGDWFGGFGRFGGFSAGSGHLHA